MARFDPDSADAVPLHVLGKEWAHVFVDDDGLVHVDSVERSPIGSYRFNQYGLRLKPEKAELLIKALKRAIKEAKRR